MEGNNEALAKLAGLAEDPSLAPIKDVMAELPLSEWYVVGGAVRDTLLGRGGKKDHDLVVRNVGLDELARSLERRGAVNYVGRRFGVLKFRPQGASDEIDIAWPRTERAGMSGAYRDFSVQSDPELPIERDVARRDFTVNAMAYALRSGMLVDPYDGLGDIERKLIRAVGRPEERFAEDYSRMLRAVRFACQLGFAIEPATWDAVALLMPRIDDVRKNDEGNEERVVPYESIAKEFLKALAADRSKAMELFEASGAMFRLMPELAPLSRCAQSAEFHSEGDAWTHTKLAMARLGDADWQTLFPGEEPTVETAVAVLLHDTGKPSTQREEGGKMTFYGHAEAGALIAKRLVQRLRLSSVAGLPVDAERVSWLVKNHLFPNLVHVDEVRRTTLEKYFFADASLGRALLHVACADAAASIRADGSVDLANLRRLIEVLEDIRRKRESESAAPAPMVTGRDVMEAAHMGPGPDVGKMLEALREAQLRGEVLTVEQAREYIKKLHVNAPDSPGVDTQ